MAFAIVRTAGPKSGLVKSIHRGFSAADRKCPTTYHAVVNIGTQVVKAGEVHPTLVDLLARQNDRRRRGLAVTGGPMDWF